ncbi:uncharacterized protein OCT59_003488 [Rhizophagus irregularis]|uniref:uncharacterized protein n=1 Tax=Rhizophagus irregularis TaxID=588596 RepID=UPI0033233DFD|nr:hypothetical protein OCT59_003488 [Rhizophagus irregularis]
MDDLKTKDKIKKIFSKDLREQIENFGICSDCKEANTGYAWCKKCDPGRFLREGKTSENTEMDEFIRESQRQTLHYYDNLEWIPFNRFDNIKPIGEGGFSIIYSAIWREGAPKYDKEKARTGPIIVALKKLKNSDMKAFINEIRIHDECNYANFHITQLYEVSTGKPPYGNVPHDEKLVLAICSGLRPNVGKGTPHCYIDLVIQCLDSNPDKRPTSKEILQKIRNWRFYDDLSHSKNSKKTKDIKMYKEFIDTNFQNSDKNFPQRETTLTLHPGAIYVSRMMSFNNNNEPKNSKGIQIEDPEAEVPDSQLVDLFVE